MMCCGCSRLAVLSLKQVPGAVKSCRVFYQINGLHTLPKKNIQGYMQARALGRRKYCCLSDTIQPVVINSYCNYLCLRMVSNGRNYEFSDTKVAETAEAGSHMEESSVKVSHLSFTVQEDINRKDSDKFNDTITNKLNVTTVSGSFESDIEVFSSGEITQAEPLPQRHIVKPVFNLAALVNKSATLSNFVKLGVDLSVVEKDREAANLMIHLDFEKEVQPLLLFLHDLGVSDADFGPLLTGYPMILQQSLEELQVRVDYLTSKNFSEDSVAQIVTKAPMLFSLSVKDIDSTLGVYQRAFKLTGDELRHVFTRLPKLFTWNSSKVKDVKFYMLDFLGFSLAEIKQIFITQPKVLLSDRHQLGKRFDYLYNQMKLSHYALVTWPQIFRTRVRVIQERHLYLKHLERAQYDPEKENYVALRSLVSGKDREFCLAVAKTSVAQYNDFLKTM